ncbi:unnamed protein product [Cyclocybe aegerita]|uniref:Nephrocystin 3-like N-terminal domain-containing protein n=1 Tax=Cyclocybe aegerita TaxID=1973307 RepID=A0A8S0X756_CYCAE|nr:unnamed protein product [Cyclocybe aegerita]
MRPSLGLGAVPWDAPKSALPPLSHDHTRSRLSHGKSNYRIHDVSLPKKKSPYQDMSDKKDSYQISMATAFTIAPGVYTINSFWQLPRALMSDLNSLVAASMLELWLCQQLLPLHDLPARWDNNKVSFRNRAQLSSPGYPLSIMDLFRDSQNNTLKDSIIIASQFGYRGSSAFDQFHAQIAEGAMHDSGERFDPPKCYPGTREVVLKQLLDWIIAHDRESFMHWLHGPAGAGKSAILQEIAERCAQMKLLIASFFFSRTAALRNNKKRLVATLAYQLAQSVPETRPYIEKAIGHDPAIFSKRLQSQFQALIVEPLSQAASTAGEEWACWPHLILIDGLDECSIDTVQQNILTCLATGAAGCGFPITVLVSSRPETHIAMTFGQHPFKYILRTALDENYRPEEDIRRFLAGTFRGIKENHPLRSYLSYDWPSPAFVEALVHKASGQFIYAATVARYVSHPDSHPAQYLDVVLGLSPSNYCEPPFAELDALYYHILSSLPDERTSLRILALVVLPSQGWNQTPQRFDSFLGLRSGVSQQILHKLASIIKLDDDSKIRLLHASLADFLLDRCRSQNFYVDVPLQAANFARLCFQNSAGATSEILFERIVLYRAFSYCSLAALTDKLLEDLADFNFPTVAQGTDEQSEVIDPPTIRTSRRPVVDGYLSCLQIIKDRFPNLSVAVYTRCQQNVHWVIGSQVELY